MPSAAIADFKYQPETKTLLVRFSESGELYRYIDVPQGVYEAFKKASSKGRFLNKYIKDRYCFQHG
jgi:hypothetical protein